MIRLSERMKHIVNLAEPENSSYNCVAEAGCDHAYITMEFIKRGYALSGIAMDIKPGPLRHARENIEAEFGSSSNKISTRLSDGVMKLKKGEADLLVIAGMGGGLVKYILEEGREVSEEIPVWILQPQTEYREIRKYLSDRGRVIVKEDMVLEDGKFYPMFRAEKPQDGVSGDFVGKYVNCAENDSIHKLKDSEKTEEELYLEYGPLLLKMKHPCLLEYLLWEKNKNRTIFKTLRQEKTEKALRRKQELEEEYERIRKALSYFESQ